MLERSRLSAYQSNLSYLKFSYAFKQAFKRQKLKTNTYTKPDLSQTFCQPDPKSPARLTTLVDTYVEYFRRGCC